MSAQETRRDHRVRDPGERSAAILSLPRLLCAEAIDAGRPDAQGRCARRHQLRPLLARAEGSPASSPGGSDPRRVGPRPWILCANLLC